MHQSLGRKVIEWRDADSAARAAERFLTELLFSPEQQERPGTERLIQEARLLRKLADEKLCAAIAAMAPQR